MEKGGEKLGEERRGGGDAGERAVSTLGAERPAVGSVVCTHDPKKGKCLFLSYSWTDEP